MWRTVLSRLLAPLVASFCGWLATRYGMRFSSEEQEKLVEAVVILLVPAMMLINGFVHKFLDRWINPMDAARTTLANPETAANVKAAHAPSRFTA